MAEMNWPTIGVTAQVGGVAQYEAGLRRIQRVTATTSASLSASLKPLSSNFLSTIGNGINNFGNQIRNLGNLISGIGYAFTFAFTLPVGLGFASAVRAGTEFEAKLVKIQDLAGASQNQIRFWSEEVLRLGPELGKMPNELLDGLYYINSVGIRDTETALDVLRRSAMASAIGMGEVGDLTKLAASTLHTFNLEASDVPWLFDALLVTVKEGGAEASEMASQFGRILPLAKQAGVELEDAFGFLATFTRSGVTPAVAVTSLANAISFLVDPTQEGQKALAEYGLTVDYIREVTKEVGFNEMLKLLNARMGPDMARVFNQRGTIGVFDTANFADTLAIVEEISSASGELEKAFLNYSDTVEFSVNRAKSSFQVLQISVFQAIKKPLADIINQLSIFLLQISELARNNPELTKLVLTFALIAAAMGPILVISGMLIRAFGSIIQIFAIPLRVLGALASVVARVVVGAFSLLAATIGKVGVAIYKVMAPAVAASGRLLIGLGQASFWVARQFLVLPNILTRFAAALRSAQVALRGMAAAFLPLRALPGALKTIFQTTMFIFNGYGDLLRIFAVRFTKALAAIPGAIRNVVGVAGRLLIGLRSIAILALEGVAGAIKRALVPLGRAVASVFSRIGALVGRALGAIATVLRKVLGPVLTVVSKAFTAFGRIISKVVSGIVSAAIKAFSFLSKVVSGVGKVMGIAFKGILTVLQTVGKALYNLLGVVANTVIQIGSMLAGLVASTLTTVVTVAQSVFGTLLTTLAAAAGAIATTITSVLASTIGSLLVGAISVIGVIAGVVAGVIALMGGAMLLIAAPIVAVAAAIAGLILIVSAVVNKVSSLFASIKSAAGGQSKELADDMKSYGKNIVEQFGKGMINGLIAVVRALRAIATTIRFWLKPGSPPKILPDLTIWGSGAMAAYMEGWTDFDFTAFNQITQQFRRFFEALLPTGDEENPARQAMIDNLLQFRDQLAGAMNEINATGSISNATWSRITAALGDASEEMRTYVRLTLEAAQAQERVAAIQKRISDAQKAWDARISPLNKGLEAIQGQRQQFIDSQRIEELNAIIADKRAPEQAKMLAQLELQEITLRQQRDALEEQRDTEMEALQAQLDSAQQTYDTLAQQLTIATEQLNLQIETNELLKEQLDLLKQAADAAGGGDGGGGGAGDIGGALEPFGPLEGLGGGLGINPDDFNFEDPIGALDEQLKELKEEISGLISVDLPLLWEPLRAGFDEFWNGTVKPTWDAIVSHPLVVETLGRIRDTIQEVIQGFRDTGTAADGVSTAMDGLKLVFGFLYSAFVGFLTIVGNFGSIFASIGNTIRTVFADLSIGFEGVKLFVEGIIDITQGSFSEGWEKIKVGWYAIVVGWKAFLADAAAGVWDFILRVGATVLEGALAALTRFLLFLEGALGVSTAGLRGWLTSVKQWLSDLVANGENLIGLYVGWLEEKWEGFKTWWSEWGTSVSEWWTTLWDTFYTSVTTIAENIKTDVSEFFRAMWEDNIKVKMEALRDEIDTILGNVKGYFETAFQGISDAIQPVYDLWERLKNAVTGFWNWLQTHVFNFSINLPDLPDWATPNSPIPLHTAWLEFSRDANRISTRLEEMFANIGGAVKDMQVGDTRIQADDRLIATMSRLTVSVDRLTTAIEPVSLYVANRNAAFNAIRPDTHVTFGDTNVYNERDWMRYEARIKRLIVDMLQGR